MSVANAATIITSPVSTDATLASGVNALAENSSLTDTTLTVNEGVTLTGASDSVLAMLTTADAAQDVDFSGNTFVNNGTISGIKSLVIDQNPNGNGAVTSNQFVNAATGSITVSDSLIFIESLGSKTGDLFENNGTITAKYLTGIAVDGEESLVASANADVHDFTFRNTNTITVSKTLTLAQGSGTSGSVLENFTFENTGSISAQKFYVAQNFAEVSNLYFHNGADGNIVRQSIDALISVEDLDLEVNQLRFLNEGTLNKTLYLVEKGDTSANSIRIANTSVLNSGTAVSVSLIKDNAQNSTYEVTNNIFINTGTLTTQNETWIAFMEGEASGNVLVLEGEVNEDAVITRFFIPMNPVNDRNIVLQNNDFYYGADAAFTTILL
ncbi:MAG TPA: hypothetical protein DCW60_02400, partial [Sutterella sp.]|nr:hypothetical protein [Sutterella sp.]